MGCAVDQAMSAGRQLPGYAGRRRLYNSLAPYVEWLANQPIPLPSPSGPILQSSVASIMKTAAAFAVGAALAGAVSAQGTPSVYVGPGVPSGTPIEGDYSGAYRPQAHYSPPQVSFRPTMLDESVTDSVA